MTEQTQQPKIIKVLHVQVLGAPTTEELCGVADVFREALDSGENNAVATHTKVQSTVQYAAGERPIDMVHVRSAMTAVEVAAVAYSFMGDGSVAWNDLKEEQRFHDVQQVVDYLNGKTESVTPALALGIESLRPYLMTASSDPEVSLWTGETNLSLPSAWTTLKFSQLQLNTVFKWAAHPDKFWILSKPVRLQYGLTDCEWVADCGEAKVSGSIPVDPSDMTKGFTLQWEIQANAVETQLPETTEEQSAFVEDAGFPDTIGAEPYEVSDVEWTEVKDPVEAQAVRDEVAAAVERGEVHPEGNPNDAGTF